MIKKPNLSEALVSKLQEDGAEVINENIVEIDLDTILKEAFYTIKDRTRVECEFKGLEDGKVKLSLKGDPSSLSVFYDRYGIEGDNTSLQNPSIADKVKQQVTDYLTANLDEPFELKLKSMSNTQSIVFIYLDIIVSSIPYTISLTVKFYEDGEMGMRFDCIGDMEKNERWSMSLRGMDDLLTKIDSLRNYYKGSASITNGK